MLFSALTILAVALAISFLCSLLEACVLSLSKAEVSALGERRPRLGRTWTALKRDVQYPLAVILILNTCAHTIGTALAAGKFELLYGERGVIVSSVVLSFVMIQWTEVLPKTLGSRRRRRVAELFGIPLEVAVLVLRPFAWLVHQLNRPFERGPFVEPPASVEEIRALSREARSAQVIAPHQDEIIGRAATLARIDATRLMVFRDEISFLSTTMTMEEALLHAHVDEHTRSPLCEGGDLDATIGYVNFKELVAALHTNPVDATLRGIARPIPYVSPERDGASILRQFVEEHLHLAIVRDESGKTLGLITMEDLIEELVGELEDEFDSLPRRVHDLGSGLLMIGGGTEAAEAFRRLGLASTPAGTVATWMASPLAGSPRPGDAVDVDGASFVVRRVRRGRVFEAAVRVGAA
jgi:putative hemolysin